MGFSFQLPARPAFPARRRLSVARMWPGCVAAWVGLRRSRVAVLHRGKVEKWQPILQNGFVNSICKSILQIGLCKVILLNEFCKVVLQNEFV